MANLSGLIITRDLTSARVSSMEMTFEPSIGIMARKVDKLGLDIRSFKEPLTRAIREVVIPSIAMNFQKYGRPRWQNLAPGTERQRTAEGSGWAILDRTGALKQTMTQMNIWHIDREKALLANLPNNVWYGIVHQAGVGDQNAVADLWHDPVTNQMVNVGASADQIHIPARPFVMIQPQDEKAIDHIFELWLDERILAAGLGIATPAVGGGLL